MNNICTKCKLSKPSDEFNWKIKNKRKSLHCKICSRKYIKEHYNNNKHYYLNKAKKRNKILRQSSHQYIVSFLKSHPCIDCGENNILVLEFDHKHRKDKFDSVSQMIKRRLSVKKIAEEIRKCEVRCSNCHRIKTEIENNSWKLKYAPVA